MNRVIQSPTDMARLLMRSCPDEAATFARRNRCNAASDVWAEFWQGVVDILGADPAATERRAGT